MGSLRKRAKQAYEQQQADLRPAYEQAAERERQAEQAVRKQAVRIVKRVLGEDTNPDDWDAYLHERGGYRDSNWIHPDTYHATMELEGVPLTVSSDFDNLYGPDYYIIYNLAGFHLLAQRLEDERG